MNGILIVIPVFDEEPSIGAVVAGAGQHGPVLVVDDGSTDGSGAVARSAGAEVIRHPRRLGKGQAIRTGLACARAREASVMVTLDGDGQHDPRDIARLLGAAERSPGAIVIGNRLATLADGGGDRESAFDGGRAGKLSCGRLNANRVAGFFAHWISGLGISDTQSGFRVYPMKLFDAVRPRAGGFVFETEVLLDAALQGWPIVEVPVAALPRFTRRSRFRPLLDGTAVARCLGRRSIRRWRTEVRDALREIRNVVGADRRRARHAAVLERAHPYAGSFPAWSLAVGAGAADFAIDGLAGWWQHPRVRRALVVGRGTAALPLLAGVAALQAIAGRMMPDLVSPLVARFCSWERFEIGHSIDEGARPR